MRTLLILIDKEFREIFRNRFILQLIILVPCITILINPLVATMDVKHLTISVIDNDKSTLSSHIVSSFDGSEYFTVYNVFNSYDLAYKALEDGKVDVIVNIPRRFERNIFSASPKKIDISSNAVNSIKGALGMQYVVHSIGNTVLSYTNNKIPNVKSDEISIQNLFNPTLNYYFFMIPALFTMLIIIICGFLPALNIVVEKENGTFEQINVTPLSKFTFTLGKLIPFWLIGLFIITICMLIAWMIYGLYPTGSIGTIYLASVLMILSISGFGVAIANRSYTILQAMFAMFFFIVLFNLMSGLITPLASMPKWAQYITNFLPPRYFITIMRSVYLKGATITDLYPNFLMLGGFALMFNLLAALTYKKQS